MEQNFTDKKNVSLIINRKNRSQSQCERIYKTGLNKNILSSNGKAECETKNFRSIDRSYLQGTSKVISGT